MNAKLFVLSTLLLCSACGKAEMSNARMNHLLAGDHGWVDLTIKSAPSMQKQDTKDCSISLAVNGETVLRESADFSAASKNGSPIGYRFPAPTGKLDIALTYSFCIKDPFVIKQALDLQKDKLTNLIANDATLTIDGTSEYQPASLESVRAQLDTVRSDAANTEHRLSNTNTLVLFCIGLNLLAVALLLWWRRRV